MQGGWHTTQPGHAPPPLMPPCFSVRNGGIHSEPARLHRLHTRPEVSIGFICAAAAPPHPPTRWADGGLRAEQMPPAARLALLAYLARCAEQMPPAARLALLAPPGCRWMGYWRACETCPAGTRGTADLLSCLQCDAGSFSATGSTACTNCPRDTVAPQAGAGACTPCSGATPYSWSMPEQYLRREKPRTVCHAETCPIYIPPNSGTLSRRRVAGGQRRRWCCKGSERAGRPPCRECHVCSRGTLLATPSPPSCHCRVQRPHAHGDQERAPVLLPGALPLPLHLRARRLGAPHIHDGYWGRRGAMRARGASLCCGARHAERSPALQPAHALLSPSPLPQEERQRCLNTCFDQGPL